MPKVGKKHFPYTPDGQAQAALERQKRKRLMDNKAQQGITDAMRGASGYGGAGRGQAPVGRGGYQTPDIGLGPKNPIKVKKNNKSQASDR